MACERCSVQDIGSSGVPQESMLDPVNDTSLLIVSSPTFRYDTKIFCVVRNNDDLVALKFKMTEFHCKN